MASYLTRLGDKEILLEAPASDAFAKSDSEVKADPQKALVNCLDTIRTLATAMGQQLGPMMQRSGASFEMSFAVRADGSGLVMVSEDAQTGQFQCTIRFGGRPPGPPRPQRPPGAPRPRPPGPPPRSPKG